MNRISYFRTTLGVLVLLLLSLFAHLQFLRIYTPVQDDYRPLPPVHFNPDTQRLFVHGTLRFAPLRLLVFGRSGQPEPARLSGFRREGLNIVPDEEGFLHGLLLIVNDQELRALDSYERLGIRYRRIVVTLDNGLDAWVYQLLETPLFETSLLDTDD